DHLESRDRPVERIPYIPCTRPLLQRQLLHLRRRTAAALSNRRICITCNHGQCQNQSFAKPFLSEHIHFSVFSRIIFYRIGTPTLPPLKSHVNACFAPGHGQTSFCSASLRRLLVAIALPRRLVWHNRGHENLSGRRRGPRQAARKVFERP